MHCLQEANKPEDAVNRTAFTAAAINYAMLLFVQQQHAKALAVLEPLYNSVEAMHGGAALCLCVLLLEIYLGSNQLPKAAQVLHYLQASTSPNTPVRAAFSPDVADEAGSNHAGDAEQGQQQASSSLRHEHLQQQSPRHAPQQQQAHLSPKRPLHLPSPKQSPGQPGMQQEGQLQNKQQQEEQQEQPTGPLTLDLPLVIRSTSAFMQQVGRAAVWWTKLSPHSSSMLLAVVVYRSTWSIWCCGVAVVHCASICIHNGKPFSDCRVCWALEAIGNQGKAGPTRVCTPLAVSLVAGLHACACGL